MSVPLMLLAAIAVFGTFFALAMFAGRRPDNSRQHRPDEQRLPTPCTCGARRFCRVGCEALARSVHPSRGGTVRAFNNGD